MNHFGAALLLLALPLCAAVPAAAQRAEFRMLVGDRVIATETVTRTADQLQGELRIGEQARIRYTAQVDERELVPELKFEIFTGAANVAAVGGRVEFRGDSALAHVQGSGVPPEQRFAPGVGALPYINLSAGLLEQIARRARAAGGSPVEVPLLSIENGAAFAVSVTSVSADSVVLRLPPGIDIHLVLDAEGRLLRGSVPAQGATIVRTDGTAAAAAVPPRSDYSAPPGAPYSAEEVRVPAPGGYSLAGTLTLPANRTGPVPAAVLISGSGLQDRDSAIPGVPGYHPFRQIADALSRASIAVLRLDDRGAGASSGDPSQATSADFADDVRAALDYLATRAEIDSTRLALIGHSEGGMIAPMVAVTDPRVAAVVLMAAPAWTGRRTSDYQLREAWKGMGLSDAEMEAKRVENDPRREEMADRMPWLRFWLDYDPLPTARRLTVPVLILQGATDRQVDAEQAGELATAIREGGNDAVTVRIFPQTNHLFLTDPIGTAGVAEYAALPSRSIPSEVLVTLREWLASRLK